jgi:hypothetical protein
LGKLLALLLAHNGLRSPYNILGIWVHIPASLQSAGIYCLTASKSSHSCSPKIRLSLLLSANKLIGSSTNVISAALLSSPKALRCFPVIRLR